MRRKYACIYIMRELEKERRKENKKKRIRKRRVANLDKIRERESQKKDGKIDRREEH
jgi:hypothetical protein